MSTNNVASITSQFPHQTLTPLAGPDSSPNYATLHVAQKELNNNATSIRSHGGGGNHGLLTLCIPAPRYLLIAGVPFEAPLNPAPAPDHHDRNGPQIVEANRLHTEERLLFRTYMDTDQALCNLIIAATPDIYLSALDDDELGFTNVTCLQMMTHLWTNYGTITQDELDANHLRMSAAWHPPTPVEDLFKQLDAGRKFATAGGEPPAINTVIRTGYNIILATGLFELACTEWRNKETALKTMPAFKTHFLKAARDQRLKATSSNSGYHSANQVTASPAVSNNSSNSGPNRTSYCWTHGTIQNLRHTSVTCMRKAEGHQDAATSSNKMNGSEKVWSNRS